MLTLEDSFISNYLKIKNANGGAFLYRRHISIYQEVATLDDSWKWPISTKNAAKIGKASTLLACWSTQAFCWILKGERQKGYILSSCNETYPGLKRISSVVRWVKKWSQMADRCLLRTLQTPLHPIFRCILKGNLNNLQMSNTQHLQVKPRFSSYLGNNHGYLHPVTSNWVQRRHHRKDHADNQQTWGSRLNAWWL